MPDTDGDLQSLQRDLKRAAGMIMSAESLLIVTHIDADGITSGGIAARTAERLGLDYRVVFEPKLTEDSIELINCSGHDLVWVCDLGSGYVTEFTRGNMVITDHHVPDPRGPCGEGIVHINPHLYGWDGSYEACGATMTYLLSKEIDPANMDCSHLAMVGAVGDFQDSNESRLVGLNRIPLEDSRGMGIAVIEEDVRIFGRETKPLVSFLQYSTDPPIPGITDDPSGVRGTLDTLGVRYREDQSWNGLDPEQKRTIREELCSRLEPCLRDRLVGEVYTFPDMPSKGGLRDAKEFATVLNSCGRYDDAETGLRICLGDPDALDVAERNRNDHRRNISVAISLVKERDMVREGRFIRWFDAGSEIRDTVVGIVAGMLCNMYGEPHIPMIAFADAEDGTKVSSRADRSLVDKGLDLSVVMGTAARMVGGMGGGHNVAAGATIPPSKKREFLDIVEDLVCAQLD